MYVSYLPICANAPHPISLNRGVGHCLPYYRHAPPPPYASGFTGDLRLLVQPLRIPPLRDIGVQIRGLGFKTQALINVDLVAIWQRSSRWKKQSLPIPYYQWYTFTMAISKMTYEIAQDYAILDPLRWVITLVYKYQTLQLNMIRIKN